MSRYTGTALYPDETPMRERRTDGLAAGMSDRALLIFLLIAATLYGFSFYNPGFPVLTATNGNATTSGYELGVLAFVIYLGISAVCGYVLGASRGSALRSLWLLGYLPSAIGSGLIGVSVLFHMNELAFGAAVRNTPIATAPRGVRRIGKLIATFSAKECKHYFTHAGYGSI